MSFWQTVNRAKLLKMITERKGFYYANIIHSGKTCTICETETFILEFYGDVPCFLMQIFIYKNNLNNLALC